MLFHMRRRRKNWQNLYRKCSAKLPEDSGGGIRRTSSALADKELLRRKQICGVFWTAARRRDMFSMKTWVYNKVILPYCTDSVMKEFCRDYIKPLEDYDLRPRVICWRRTINYRT